MTALSIIRLVAWRDFRERARSKAFIISTGFTLVLVVAVAIIPMFFTDDEPPVYQIGVLEPAPGLQDQLDVALADQATAELQSYATQLDGEAALRDDTIAALVTPDEIVLGPSADARLRTVLPLTLGSMDLLERARAEGLTDTQVAEILAAAQFPTRDLEPEDESETENRLFAFVGTVLLFISLITYGQWITIGVIEEKSSRVVEVVLGTVRPRHLLAGKMLGIGSLGLIQLTLIGLAGLAALAATGDVAVPAAAGMTVVSVVLWFVLGFGFYSAAFAAAGSLVSRQEDAQNVVFPISMLLIVAYFIATTGLAGDNPALRIASLVPPTAPTTMPLRMVAGDAAVWEIALSVTLMVTATWLLVRGAARVYAGGLLRNGRRVRVREALRTAQS